MASIKEKFETKDRFDIDRDLDIPDFNFDLPEVKDDRNPVVKVASGIAAGVKDSVFNPNIIRSTITKSLPKAYGDALGVVDYGADTVRTLYNSAAQELKPAINDLKNVSRRILPKAEGILPKKISEMIKDWSKENSYNVDLSTERQREDTLSMELGSIFQAQAEQEDKHREQDVRRDQLNQGIEQIRHRGLLGELNSVRLGIARQVAYQDNVTANYQKKSLELQFRSYFALTDLLETQKKAAEETKQQLSGVVKNTGLPDFAKIHTSESFQELARNKFLGSVQDSLFGDTGDYVKKLIDNVAKSVKTTMRDAIDSATSITSVLDLASNAGDMGDDAGMDAIAVGSRVAGGVGGDYLVGKGQKWLGKKLAQNPGVLKTAENIRYRLDNAGGLIDNSVNDWSTDWGPAEGLREFLRENLPNKGADLNFETASIDAMNQPDVFSRATNRSIIEIIPGFLARIHRELAVMRTGDNSLGLISYDFNAGKFSTNKEIASKITGDIGSEYNREAVGKNLDDVVKMVDKDGTFSEKENELVRKKLLDLSLRKSSTDSKVLSDQMLWRESDDGGEKIAQAFAQLFEADYEGNRSGSLESIRNQRILSEKVRKLTERLGDPRADIQTMINLGQMEQVRQSGLLRDDHDALSLEAIRDLLLKGQVPQKPPSTDLDSSGPNAPLITPGGDTARRQARLAQREAERQARMEKNEQRRDQREQRRQELASAIPSQSPITFDSSEIVSGIDSLKEYFSKSETPSIIKTIGDNVAKIEESLRRGIYVYGNAGGTFDGEMPPEFTGPRKQGFWSFFNRKKDRIKEKLDETYDDVREKLGDVKDKAAAWYDKGKSWSDWRNMTIGDLAGKATGAGVAVLKHAKTVASRAGTIATGAIQTGAKYGKIALDKGVEEASKLFGDIYVKGEGKPRLTRAKMLAGEYFDQVTGRVLTSLKDIKGNIVDKDGNIILDASEIENSYMTGGKTQLLKNVIGTAWKTGSNFAGQISSRLGGLYGTAFKLGVGALKTAKKFLPPYDVYVKGSDTPIMFATQMRLGKYFSKKTGSAITHPSQIDGPVIDDEGNYVVTDEQIEAGLVDKDGIGVGNKVGRLLNKVRKVASVGLKILKGAADNAMALITGFGQSIKDIFGGIFGLRGEYLDTAKAQLDIQTKIYELLFERLPKKEKVLGDIDGDGIRDGSAFDLRQKDEKEEEKKESIAEKAKAEGSPGMIKSTLAGLAGLIKGKGKKDEEEEDDGSLLSDAGDIADIYDAANGDGERDGKGRKGKKGKGKVGRLAKLGQGAKSVGKSALKWGGRLLGGAGIAYGAYKTVDNVSQGNYGEAAVDAGLTAGGVALMGGGGALLTGASAVGSVAATAAGGILGLITAPVALTALGIGAAYLGYKYLTRKQLETLSTVRYAQYGFNESDKDHFKAIFEMEDKLEPLVKQKGDKASLDEDKEVPKELMELFDVNPKNRQHVHNWSIWFAERFKPVFLSHISVLRSIRPDTNLKSVDSKLTPAEKLKYLEATQISSGPYSVSTSPFPDLRVLVVDGRGVTSAYEIAKTKLEKEAKDDKSGTSKIAAGATVAAGAAAAASMGPDGKPVKPAQAADGSALPAALAGAGAAVATVSDGGAKINVQNSIPSDFIFTGQEGRMDALTSIRYKTYGLVEMEQDKVRSLRYLELFVGSGLKFGRDGASFNSDVEAVLERVKSQFGISGSRSPRGYAWMTWFKSRFLPVFLNFATGVEKLVKDKDPIKGEMKLKPNDAISVANIIISTTAVYNSKTTSVWNVSESPWREYALNLDKDTIEGNLEALTQTAKAVVLNEHRSAKIKAEVTANAEKNQKQQEAGKPQAPSTAAGAPSATDRGPTNRINQTAAQTNNVPGQIQADGTGVRAVGDYTGGAPVKHPGKGTGGDINQIPDMQGAGWDAAKATLIAAANMAGVDPKTLATITAIESNFNPTAKPPIDRATGKRASSATGLMQFIAGTWNSMLKKYGAKYGIAPDTPPTDPRANALMGAEYIKENMAYLKSKVSRPLTTTDVYMAHFLGAGGAEKFLKADPNSIGASTMGDAAKANPTIFYKKSGEPRTMGEIYQLFTEKLNKRLKQSNVPDSAFGEASKPTADGKPADTNTGGASTSTAPPGKAPEPPPSNVPPTQANPKTEKQVTGTGRGGVQDQPSSAPGATAVAQAGYGSSIKKTGEAAAAKPQTGSEKAADALATTAQSYPKVAAVSPSTPVQVGDVKSNDKPAVVPVAYKPPPQSEAPAQSPIRRDPNFMGFGPSMTPRPEETKAQDSALSKKLAGDVSSIGVNLAKQLTVQTEIRDLLKNAMGQMTMKSQGGNKSTTAEAPQSSSPQNTNSASQPPRKAPAAPVSTKNASFG